MSALILFGLVLLGQVFVWRVIRPRLQILWLFALYFPPTLLPFGHSALYLSLAFAYVLSFPAIQAKSPSLRILEAVGMTKELERSQLLAKLASESLEERRADLSGDRLVGINGRLSPAGWFIATIFYWYRKLLGLRETG